MPDYSTDVVFSAHLKEKERAQKRMCIFDKSILFATSKLIRPFNHYTNLIIRGQLLTFGCSVCVELISDFINSTTVPEP